jgi:tetratricopeptide (TPR) repeat protein
MRAEPASERENGVYGRSHVCRLLQISGRQLRTWERQQLIPELSEYRFSDLLLLKTIGRLRQENIPPLLLRRTLQALRARLSDSPQLFHEARIFKEGNTLHVRIGKHKMEALSGQLVLDFHEPGVNKLFQLARSEKQSERVAAEVRRKMEADAWFERGLEQERIGGPMERIIEAYEKAIECDPQAAGALVNLGTIYFNGHAWADAEAQYLKALTIDPNYPLAHFNLGNLYDERGDFPNALEHYRAAIRLCPTYADAHYNIALLYQGRSDLLSAVRHWKAYLKLDSASSWSQIARRELAKLEAATVLPGARSVRAAAATGEAPAGELVRE